MTSRRHGGGRGQLGNMEGIYKGGRERERNIFYRLGETTS
jgi:hypothetical protein